MAIPFEIRKFRGKRMHAFERNDHFESTIQTIIVYGILHDVPFNLVLLLHTFSSSQQALHKIGIFYICHAWNFLVFWLQTI